MMPPLSMTLRWPLPALLAWAGCWGSWLLLRQAGLAWPLALALAEGVALAVAWRLGAAWRWRRVLVLAGFPLSWLAVAAGAGLGLALPPWAWLLPLAALLLTYPLRAWRDAPLYPSPRDALDGLRLALPAGAVVLDAGCGLGHGLRALHRQWPQARLEGVEWSWPLRLLAALRCPYARVRQGDMWAGDWRGLSLVYLFQRPESMPRAWAKACAEMAPGSWLLSLDFAVPGVTPQACVTRAGRPTLWLYRVPGQTVQLPAAAADNRHHAAAGAPACPSLLPVGARR